MSETKAIAKAGRQKKSGFGEKLRRENMKFQRNKGLLAMCILPAIKIIIFSYLPMIGVIIAFKNFRAVDGIFGSAWVGLKNFEFFFKSNDAWRVMRNTLTFNVVNILSSLLTNIVVALLLYEVSNRIALKAYQTVLFIPHFFSYVLVGLMLTPILSSNGGLLTQLVEGMSGVKFNFYAKPLAWLIILPLVNLWKGVGYGSLIYYSTLMSIDASLFEAAEIDGANKFQRIRHISIPTLLPMACVLTIMSVGDILNSGLGLFYYVTRDAKQLYEWTDVIDTYVFRSLTTGANFSVTSAVTLFQNVVGLILVVVTNKIARAVDKEYALY